VAERKMTTRYEIRNANEVHIHVSHLDGKNPEPVQVESILSHAELARANRLPEGSARGRFTAGRLFLRETLSEYLDVKPGKLPIYEGEWGKPYLARQSGHRHISFNLSHSAEMALLAISGGIEVGVDMERVAERLSLLEMARLFFSQRELEEFLSLPGNGRLTSFYRCWTRKEAYMKGCGRGLSLPSDSFDVSLLPGRPPALLAHRIYPAEPERWSLIDIAAPEGFCAALAIEGRPPGIRYISGY
jgi:4'-phosphopantetheinyl transferase